MSYIACQVLHQANITVTHHTGDAQTDLGPALPGGIMPHAGMHPHLCPPSARSPHRHLRAHVCQKSVSVNPANIRLTFCRTKRRERQGGSPLPVHRSFSVSLCPGSVLNTGSGPGPDSCEQDVQSPLPHGACHPQLER